MKDSLQEAGCSRIAAGGKTTRTLFTGIELIVANGVLRHDIGSVAIYEWNFQMISSIKRMRENLTFELLTKADLPSY